MTLLETHHLKATIGGLTICTNLNLGIESAQFWGVLGCNGVGKTTLLHTLAGLREAAAGEINLRGRPLRQYRRREVARHIGIVLQDESYLFPVTVFDIALSGRYPHSPMWQRESGHDIALARAALQEVELSQFSARLANTLSGGERRRLAIATVLAQDPDLYLLDEPVNHLDPHQQMRLLELLADRAQSGAKALMAILHDVNLAARFCTHLLLLFGQGKVLYGPKQSLLRQEIIEDLYQHPVHCLEGPAGRFFFPR